MMISWLRFQNSVWNDDLLTEDDDGDHQVTEKYGFGFGAADEQCMRVCSAASVASGCFRPMNCRPPGSSVHRIHQARILEWVVISFSRTMHKNILFWKKL